MAQVEIASLGEVHPWRRDSATVQEAGFPARDPMRPLTVTPLPSTRFSGPVGSAHHRTWDLHRAAPTRVPNHFRPTVPSHVPFPTFPTVPSVLTVSDFAWCSDGLEDMDELPRIQRRVFWPPLFLILEEVHDCVPATRGRSSNLWRYHRHGGFLPNSPWPTLGSQCGLRLRRDCGTAAPAPGRRPLPHCGIARALGIAVVRAATTLRHRSVLARNDQV